MTIDPAENYRDRLDPAHKMAMDAVFFTRQFLGPHRDHFEKLIQSKAYMDDVGGLLDPTLYRDMIYSKSFEQQMRVVKAALAFLKEMDSVAAEVGKQA